MPTTRICPNGHRYFKSSDCPVCPVCELARRPQTGILSGLPAPARRALEAVDIRSAEQLVAYTEAEILALHGMGPAAMARLKTTLNAIGLSFKNE